MPVIAGLTAYCHNTYAYSSWAQQGYDGMVTVVRGLRKSGV
ncbi:hypothetical protein AB0436_29445 [Streptomyces sp. NPDC051322]